MKIVDRAKFFTWYDELVKTEYVFDFAAEIKRYCISDVNLLRQGCLSFRKMFLEITEICPFAKAVTIASACSVVYRTNFLKQDSIGIIPKSGYRGFDNQSIIALEWFAWIEHERGYRIEHAGRGAEKVLPGGLKVDGYYETDSGKTVFEFYGCWFHGCPKCYPSDRDNANIVNDVWLTLNERYERTMLKSSRIRTLGYHLEEIWEHEYRHLRAADNKCKNFIEHSVPPVLKKSRLAPRHAFYGGRTGNTRTYYKINEGEQIRYLDVTSLYPTVNKYDKFPVGHPVVYIDEECKQVTGDDNDISKVEGLIKCTVLPPRNLYHPVLPVRMHGKLMFALCRSCCDELHQNLCTHENSEDRTFTVTWVSVELQKAVGMGYIITKIEEIWQYEISQ
ncbi:uncharacterized protein LOC107264981 [Cephus cinctus]|uniref:DNA-directed DNA polymerase n=1 Tax=Cephus cinctus TaxID=211228 RepID=A0AAJ7BM09_CEPCN|nr:uncharacterized protein LOC107264981 [Cephus cinctus]